MFKKLEQILIAIYELRIYSVYVMILAVIGLIVYAGISVKNAAAVFKQHQNMTEEINKIVHLKSTDISEASLKKTLSNIIDGNEEVLIKTSSDGTIEIYSDMSNKYNEWKNAVRDIINSYASQGVVNWQVKKLCAGKGISLYNNQKCPNFYYISLKGKINNIHIETKSITEVFKNVSTKEEKK